MPGIQVAYTLKFRPIVLKKLVIDCGISQTGLSEALDVSRALVNVVINRGYIPTTMPELRTQLQAIIEANTEAMAWLSARGLQLPNIWDALGEDLRQAVPAGRETKRIATRRQKAMVPGDPGYYEQEVSEMLTDDARKHFKLFRSPFQADIRDMADIYMSDEHRYIEAAMLDAAKHGGALVVIGEVGSGKSVIRKKVVAELSKDENSRVIFPRMIDKTRISAASVCDAIIMDLSNDTPKNKLEQKSRQVEQLLIARSKSGCHVCLMIEEAHDLTVKVLKLLKRFYEIEDGYKKTLGIILIGQPELDCLFNEADNYGMREVIRRFQVARIRGLNGNLKDYLALKFKRVNADLKNVMTDGAISSLAERLTEKDGRGRKINKAYPLTANNKVTLAMNLACEMGEVLVTEEVINAL